MRQPIHGLKKRKYVVLLNIFCPFFYDKLVAALIVIRGSLFKVLWKDRKIAQDHLRNYNKVNVKNKIGSAVSEILRQRQI